MGSVKDIAKAVHADKSCINITIGLISIPLASESGVNSAVNVGSGWLMSGDGSTAVFRLA
jgi:hypothetical protein